MSNSAEQNLTIYSLMSLYMFNRNLYKYLGDESGLWVNDGLCIISPLIFI